MAILKDLIVNGASRFIGDIIGNKAQLTTLYAPTSAGGTTYGAGTNGQVLKSNGSTLYWAADSNTTSLTITANATDGLWDLTGTNGSNAVTYALAPYSAKQTNASFYTTATNPTLTTRLNYDGYLYATKLYSGGTEVLTSHQTVTNNNISVSWNTETTIATIGSTPIKIKIPANPNTNTDTLVKQTASTTAGEYKLLATASTSPTSGNAAEAIYNADVTINPNTKAITATTYKVTSNGTITYNSSNGCIEIIV